MPVWCAGKPLDKSVPARSNLIHGDQLTIEAFDDGFYALRSATISEDVLRAEVGVDTAKSKLRSSLYPRHLRIISPFKDELGAGHLLTVTHTGLLGMPDLVSEFRVYDSQPWGEIRVSVKNSTGEEIELRAIHVAMCSSGTVLFLNGPAAEDRVLSDSFTEDPVKLLDLDGAENGMHRAFGSQLIYNRKSKQSFFLGALSADRFLTIFHLHSSTQPDLHLLSYDISEAGTNEPMQDQNKGYPPANDVPFRLKVPAGKSLDSERLMFSISSDYHKQLENYGRAVRILHKSPIPSSNLIGWWSWTAYYYGVTENTILTNAQWLAQNLASLGYRYFQIDEGYSYARGEYAVPDGHAFPHGMAYAGDQINKLGLTFGVWAGSFEVSARSWVYEHHRDWLVHTLAGEPVHIGRIGALGSDELYALDPTNPGAQEYLRWTYRTMVKDWGVRFIKIDFMDVSTVEGVYYRPNTTALEAQRIGLETIREAVGDDVVIDKDGSPMLSPVGIVNAGRISQDTGHTFGSTRDAATGVAARYYMNRNFFLSDPDAFTVSKQVLPDRDWHGNKTPLTQDEAEASIALSAVSGGMFEIGDDLPALGASPERLALVKNSDLLDMAKLSRASVPLDLMTYSQEDEQPSLFLLKESRRQQIVTVFNWAEGARSHTLSLNALGLNPNGTYSAFDVLRGGALPIEHGALVLTLPAHSVRIVKLLDTSVTDAEPDFEVHAPANGKSGALLKLQATSGSADAPVLSYHWEFGDGVTADGADVSHTYTQPQQYTVTVTAIGLNEHTTKKMLEISITGMVPTIYNPSLMERYTEGKRSTSIPHQ
jgi:hypothetical protein